MEREASTDTIIVKKYSNRRLYDTDRSTYVKLSDVAQMIRDGKDVRVVDAKSGEDLTKLTMLQIICENKADQEALPVSFLRRVIQAGNQSIRSSIRETLSAGWKTHREVQRQVTDLVRLGLAMNPFLVPFMPRKDKQGSRQETAPSPAQTTIEQETQIAMTEQVQQLPVEQQEEFTLEMSELDLLRTQLAMLQQKVEQLEDKS